MTSAPDWYAKLWAAAVEKYVMPRLRAARG